jgi:hypothetical protein
MFCTPIASIHWKKKTAVAEPTLFVGLRLAGMPEE